MKKVLYISYDGMTDPLGQSQVLPYLKGLSQLGHQIAILSFEKKNRFENLAGVIEEQLEESKIAWHPLEYTSFPPVLSAIYDYRKMKRKAAKLHQKFQFDIVHSRSYLPGMAGLNLKQKFGVRFLFDMRGFWADERAEGGIWPRTNPLFNRIYKYFKKQEKTLLSNADYTVSLTHKGKETILHFPYIKQETAIEVIPCCADFKHFDYTKTKAENIKKWRTQLEINKDEIILSYLGSIGTWYLLPKMLDFFKVLLSMKETAKMLFITRDNPEMIYSEATKNGIEREKIIVQPANRDEVPELLALSSFSIFFIQPVFSKRASSPTKLAEILGMGIPVFANSGVGDIDGIFKSAFPELLIENLKKEEYTKKLSGFLNGKIHQREYLRKTGMEQFSLEMGIQTYNKIYQTI